MLKIGTQPVLKRTQTRAQSRRRTRRAVHTASSGPRRGGSGRSGTASSTDEDSDHAMADYSPTSDSPPAGPRYRLRRKLLQKRSRNNGSGAGVRGRAGEDSHDLPRVPLSEVIGVFSGGPSGRRDGEAGHDPATYGLFVNLVERMLDHRPESR